MPDDAQQSNARRFIFSGHAIGAAAQFHKLDKTENLNHMVPALGASVLPPTGGLSKSEVSNYAFEVTHPRRRSLLTVHKIETRAVGTVQGTKFITETEAKIESITVVDKLHIDFVKVHVVATRNSMDAAPSLTSDGNKIEGIHLGGARVVVHLDDEMLCAFGTEGKINEYLQSHPGSMAKNNGIYQFSLVREIELHGLEREQNKITPVGKNALKWDNFGTIFFGEVVVNNDDRQVTMIRLQMGSDAGGSGTVGDGQSNGHVGSG